VFACLQMASFLRRFLGPKKPRQTRKDSITGRNKTLALDNRLLSIRCDINKSRLCFNACVDGEWGNMTVKSSGRLVAKSHSSRAMNEI
ncbi:hypothetical protein TELCIR_16283, partial [Teladorsagia circumcincta]